MLALAPLSAGAQGGLVQCGIGAVPCTFCDLVSLTNRLINFAFVYLLLPIFTIGIIAAGITIATARASMTQVLKGRQMLTNMLIGFFIAASAWVVVHIILVALVSGNGAGFENILNFSLPSCNTSLNPPPSLNPPQ